MRHAAYQGDAQAVAAWLEEGGGVDAARDDTTLLMAAAYGGQEAIVRMLLQRGASVNLESPLGTTALMLAAANDHTTTVQALLDAKADISLQAESGYTALMMAEHREHIAAAQLLRQHAKTPAEAEAGAVMHAAATAPKPNISGRVRIFGLKPQTLNPKLVTLYN